MATDNDKTEEVEDEAPEPQEAVTGQVINAWDPQPRGIQVPGPDGSVSNP